MRDEQFAVQAGKEFGRDGVECRRAAHHRIRDAGQLLNEGRNRLLRIDEAAPARDAGRPDFDDADLGNAVLAGRAAGGFKIDKDDGLCEGRFGQKLFGHGENAWTRDFAPSMH
ncbi:hypothetical protein ABIE53_003224 [Burkholderia sp. OAS925]